jgi:hypothetical protein
MVRRYIRENKGKSLLIAGIVLMWAVLGVLFINYGYEETWQLWGVPTEMPPFKDFRLIPGSAESFRNGFEPSIKNPGDPNGRIFNYPAFWRLFFYTNITQDDTIWISVLMLMLFFISAILFPQKLSALGAVLMLFILFSPASMLLYERGNADLIVFFICALIILALGYSSHLAWGLILFGAVVKMFPFFGITVLLKESKRKFYLLLAAGIVFMVVYSLLTFQSQSAAWNTTMRGDGISYGSFVLITRLGDYLQTLYPGVLPFGGWQVLFEALALALILLGVILGIRRPNPLETVHERHLAAFRMGASIYVGTFLLGNNWDYRLAFLVLVIPQLSEWLCLNRKGQRAVVIGVMLAVILSCWHFYVQFDAPFIPLKDPANRSFVVDEFINWLLLLGFAYLLAASFPDWLRQDLQKFLGMAKTKPAGA